MTRKTVLFGSLVGFGMAAGALISPLLAEGEGNGAERCFIGENSNAACAGEFIYFVGNTSNLDSGAWVVRISGESGRIWYRDGRKMVLLREPEE